MFRLKKSLTNTTPVIEYYEGTVGEVFLYGEALKLSDGKLTKCSGAEKPSFISLGSITCKENAELIPVMRVFDFYAFECPIEGNADALKIGTKVTLDNDGMGVTDVTASGVAEITEKCGEYVTVIL